MEVESVQCDWDCDEVVERESGDRGFCRKEDGVHLLVEELVLPGSLLPSLER